MTALMVTLVVLGAIGFGSWRVIQGLDGERKRAIKDRAVGVFDWAEAKGYLRRAPAFESDYHAEYPELRLLESDYATVRKECQELLGMKERITDVEALGGGYTDGGIHAIAWKSFMFKSGEFIESNCRMAPETTKILAADSRPLYGLLLHSRAAPIRYAALRLLQGLPPLSPGRDHPGQQHRSERLAARQRRQGGQRHADDHSLIEKGEKYYWHDGEGVMFDDTYLHDAANDSDEVRVVLWLDVARKAAVVAAAPFNKFFLFLVHRDDSISVIREQCHHRTEGPGCRAGTSDPFRAASA